jgi:hypothetical protein
MNPNKKPGLVGQRKPGSDTESQNNYNISRIVEKQSFDDYNLPSPASYYDRVFPNLLINREWAKVICPFHDDNHPSLSINLKVGCFKCHSCGAKGGGIIKFHMMKRGISFRETIQQLEAGQW